MDEIAGATKMNGERWVLYARKRSEGHGRRTLVEYFMDEDECNAERKIMVNDLNDWEFWCEKTDISLELEQKLNRQKTGQ